MIRTCGVPLEEHSRISEKKLHGSSNACVGWNVFLSFELILNYEYLVKAWESFYTHLGEFGRTGINR